MTIAFQILKYLYENGDEEIKRHVLFVLEREAIKRGLRNTVFNRDIIP